ncbi:hypothetical protein K474DRAFT_1710612 [Panus rudis PR-1116 ss-1]|nr:hypothetical protein K474DRAFT_1710612 [Panus rudis PR-1116 ss-1]
MSNYPNDPVQAEPGSSTGPGVSENHSVSNASPERAGTLTPDHHDEDGGEKRKKPAKRRKVNHACLYCRRSHMTCDEGRPCQRCIKREIGHLCHDERRPSGKDKDKTMASTSSTVAAPSTSAPQVDMNKSIPGKQFA